MDESKNHPLSQAAKRLKDELAKIESDALVEKAQAEKRRDFKAMADIEETARKQAVDAQRAYEDALHVFDRQRQDWLIDNDRQQREG